jgi:hypothetical protein
MQDDRREEGSCSGTQQGFEHSSSHREQRRAHQEIEAMEEPDGEQRDAEAGQGGPRSMTRPRRDCPGRAHHTGPRWNVVVGDVIANTTKRLPKATAEATDRERAILMRILLDSKG